uniref:Uncharacterized protein n=1 Tax=Mimiviridae sp. ChoanoV1 TaxID=2596887 RepID=A0A5B8IH01_9VIRU|nr:hypothetical protein 8_44 [Mimiviridae sp. ChoanoV1]
MRDSGYQEKILNKYTTPSRVEITLTVDSDCKELMEKMSFSKMMKLELNFVRKFKIMKFILIV